MVCTESLGDVKAKDDPLSAVDSAEMLSCCGREDDMNVEECDWEAGVEVVSRGDDSCVVLV